MKVLVIGSGGREHALCWKIAQSPKVDKLYCAPGNAGTAMAGENVPIDGNDLPGLLAFAMKEKIDLTCVGPEAPLVSGIADLFAENGLKIFGPNRKAALLEGSKRFAKEIMSKYGVPTADSAVFSDAEKAERYIAIKGTPIVVKADGLAAGKGVFVCATRDEAKTAVRKALKDNAFGAAGTMVVIEEALSGEEASVLALSDGRDILTLESSQDHKRAFDYDKGPNTGGMGAYSPAPVITDKLAERIRDEIIIPVIHGMSAEGIPYKGLLYAGIMVTKDGPKVLEFNVRFGDPEAQAVLPRMKTDLVELMEASISGGLKNKKIEWGKNTCVSVVLASGGYPGSYEKGKIIRGLEKFADREGVIVFHAGTTVKDGNFVTNGGRVLSVAASAEDIRTAVDKAYKACGGISFDKMRYRTDIGARALTR